MLKVWAVSAAFDSNSRFDTRLYCPPCVSIGRVRRFRFKQPVRLPIARTTTNEDLLDSVCERLLFFAMEKILAIENSSKSGLKQGLRAPPAGGSITFALARRTGTELAAQVIKELVGIKKATPGAKA